jgi:hypothetical protein
MTQDSDDNTHGGESAEDREIRLGAYDLDGDGKVGPIEDLRAGLGLLDAQLEEAAEEGGVKGKIADAAHHLVDRMDND